MSNIEQENTSKLLFDQIKTLEDDHEVNVYAKRPFAIVRGEGSYVYDSDGKKYLDFVTGIGTAILGHAHPHILEAINQQAQNLITCPEIFYNDRRAELIQKLINLTPKSLNQVFFCNSGTEAVEAAIKFSRITTKRTKIISAMRGFHGRTMGALSATFNPKYRKPFAPLVPGFTFVPFNNIDRLEKELDDNTAAVILEVIQGNGGIHIASDNYLQEVELLCRENGTLLIIDEVQTGFYRTGTLFSFQKYGIMPDIVCMAKGMAGGVPIGAVLCTDEIKLGTSQHGSTFGGNPLAMASSLAVIEYLSENDFGPKVIELGEYFLSELQKCDLSIIREIRQVGLMIGIELKQRVYSYIEKLQNKGLLSNPAGSTVIRLLPPLNVSKTEIDEAVNILCNVLKKSEFD